MDLSELLKHSESSWLDWKADFPPGVSKGDDERKKGIATIIKDIVAVANSQDDKSIGFLVYGVKDHGTSRSVVGITGNLDDAELQQFVQNNIDPIPDFCFRREIVDSKEIAIIEIRRVPHFPHVVKGTFKDVFYEGQVWYRQGSKNCVAISEKLKEMAIGPKPFGFQNSSDLHYKSLSEKAC